MASSLREDEQFVIEALCASYNGTWRIGEDPPDAYMALKGNEVAVEISILTQHVVGISGKSVPRLSQEGKMGSGFTTSHFLLLFLFYIL